jgi:hypothetical protein
MIYNRTASGRNVRCIYLLGALVLTGCSIAKNTDTPQGEFKVSPSGVKYVLTCIEGKQFIATQAAYYYWQLAGPIKDCEMTPNAS